MSLGKVLYLKCLNREGPVGGGEGDGACGGVEARGDSGTAGDWHGAGVAGVASTESGAGLVCPCVHLMTADIVKMENSS